MTSDIKHTSSGVFWPNDSVFDASPMEHHSMIIGKSGKGKSIVTEQFRADTRKTGGILLDTELYREGGLYPYEYELTGRIVNGLTGMVPRGLRQQSMCIISDVCRPQKQKRQAVHLVTTKNNVVLDRRLIKEACDQLQQQSGILLNQPQIIELMEPEGIDERIEEFGEVETQIRETLADALSRSLIGVSWPQCGELYNSAPKSQIEFAEEFDIEATKAGYKVCYNRMAFGGVAHK